MYLNLFSSIFEIGKKTSFSIENGADKRQKTPLENSVVHDSKLHNILREII